MQWDVTLDARTLPDHAFGPRAPIWWGTLGLVAIESTMFAILLASWFYLRGNFPTWPPAGTALPAWPRGTANVVLLFASVWPMYRIDQLAQHGGSRQQIERWLWAALAVCAAILVVRGFEFAGLGCRWSDHAYGSVVWTLLAMHAGHLLASTLETVVLTVYLGRRALDEHHRLDLSVNSLYWYFVVVSWLPIWGVVYLGVRWS